MPPNPPNPPNHLNPLNHLFLFLLTLVFTAALMFAFVELPAWFDKLLQQRGGFPQMDQGMSDFSAYQADLFMSAYGLRVIGYVCLFVVVVMIVLGIVLRKTRLAWIGALAIFLPVFGSFALSMFYLAGLGILRVLWLPVMDVSMNLIDFGQAVMLPYDLIQWLLGLFGWDGHDFTVWLFMGSGAFLFATGVYVWVTTRYQGIKVATHWVYRISRHPQYLGWLIWSYGIMLFSSDVNQMKRSWGMTGTLAWLIMAMVIVAVCMIEELKMSEKAGDEYDRYRSKTPFLLPLPRFMRNMLWFPVRWLFRTRYPKHGSQVLGIMGFYTLVLLGISFFWVDLKPDSGSRIDQDRPTQSQLDSLVANITDPRNSRVIPEQFTALREAGIQAVPSIKELMDHPVERIRVEAVHSYQLLLGGDAKDQLLTLLSDSSVAVRRQAYRSLAQLKDHSLLDTLISYYHHPETGIHHMLVYNVLGEFSEPMVREVLVNGTRDSIWHFRYAALQSLVKSDSAFAIPFVIEALSDTVVNMRRSAVYLLLQLKPPQALEPLMKLSNDQDFEVRFYSNQAVKQINLQKSRNED